MAGTRAAGTAGRKRAGAKKTVPQPTTLGYADLISMVELIERANAFSEFRLKVGAIEIEFRRRPDGTAVAPRAVQPDALPAAIAAAPAPAPAATLPASTSLPPGTIAIRAPMVGTFYRAPAPGATPFVEVGQRVEAGSTLCIIEVMKLMNTVDAATAGTVVEIRAQDATPVAHDQVLIVFRPED